MKIVLLLFGCLFCVIACFAQRSSAFPGDASLFKQVSKQLALYQKGKHTVATGLTYTKLKDNDLEGTLCNFHQARIPLLYTARLAERIEFEAGTFFGINLYKPFRNLFFETDRVGLSAFQRDFSLGALLRFGYRISATNILQVQYVHETASPLGSLGNLRMGMAIRF